jgi:16S rRNA (guanine966-N2)-methyltransferase
VGEKSKLSTKLRIIGGQWRGRKLSIANVDGLRPTGNRIRETLFNWLSADITDSVCLDLFAGSGALGFESVSRGAAHVTMLEKNSHAYRTLQQHCQTLQTHRTHVIEQDCLLWLKQPSLKKASVDIAFIDPPFALSIWHQTIDALISSQLLKHHALIYVETPRDTTIQVPDLWKIHKEKQAGQVCFRLFCHSNPD